MLVTSVCAAISACSGSTDPVELFQHGEYDASFKIFNVRAAAGDIVAANYLGTHYYLGAGVERDFVRAAEWFEVAALAEDPAAQRSLGIMYLRGLGVEKDYHEAYGWMYFAYRGGNTAAKGYLNAMSDNVTPNAGGIARRNVRKKIAAHAAQLANSIDRQE